MKIIYLLVLAFTIGSCQTSKNAKMFTDSDLQLNKATQERWFGGQPGIRGINYTLTLANKSGKTLVIDSLYVKDQWHKVKVLEENPYKVYVHTREALQRDEASGEFRPIENTAEVEEKDGENFQAKNVLMYYKNGKKYYYEILDFETIEPKMFP